MRKISLLLVIISVVLSDIMCAVVAYNYCELRWGIKYLGYSVSPNIAFIYAIPFLIVIIVLLTIAYTFRRDRDRDEG